MKPTKQRVGSAKQSAFTLVELVVVIAVLGVLVVTALAGTSGDVSKRLLCADNLRRLTSATQMWADDNGGKFSNDGNVQVNITSQAFRNTLTNTYKLERKHFYCPSNPELNIDSFWQSTGSQSVLGYSYFVGFPQYNDLASVATYYPANGALPGGDNLRNHMPIFATNTTDQAYYPIVWADLNQKFNGDWGRSLPRSANHFGGSQPLGSNESYLDGRVEWASAAKFVGAPKMQVNGLDIYFYAGKP